MGTTDDILRRGGITPTSRRQFLEVGRVALDRLALLGVAWKGTRFETYLRLLEEAASRTYPRRIDWVKDRGELLVELEAIGQMAQLACATQLRERVERALLLDRLRYVVGGRPIPTEVDDKPRNTLLELTAGYLLFHGGAGVELTTAREDLVIHLPGVSPVPAECKRPLGPWTVERNVKGVRRQLEATRDRYPIGGLAVFGLDRVAGVSGDLGNVARPEDLADAVKDVLDGGAREIRRLGGAKLERVAIAVVTVLVGAVYLVEPPLPTGVLRIASLPLARGDAQCTAAQEALSAVFSSTSGPTLDELLVGR